MKWGRIRMNKKGSDEKKKEKNGKRRKRRKRDTIWPELGFKIFRF